MDTQKVVLGNVWNQREVLVTGAGGFIGSHLVETLLQHNAKVTALVRRASHTQVTHKFQNLQSCLNHPALSILAVDLAGRSAMNYLLETKAQTWFHLAADAYVPASLSQPVDVVLNNITSTMNILEAARKLKPENVVIMSSSEVYGPSSTPIAEEHPLHPTTPYAASKVACDRLAWSYKQCFDTPVTIVRPFNTYGPRHVYDVIPLFIYAALQNKPITIFGDGTQTRDFTYVTDTVSALLMLGARQGQGEIFNVGTNRDHAIRDLAQLIKEFAQSRSEIVFAPPRLGEVQKLQADASLLRKVTSWQSTVTLEEGLRMNIDWAKRYDHSC